MVEHLEIPLTLVDFASQPTQFLPTSTLSNPGMAPTPFLQHRRTHNLLLISKLLNQRDASSPFTLVLDSLEQSGKPLLAEYMKRASVSSPCIGNCEPPRRGGL